MNYRLKRYATVQCLTTKIAISGCYGQGDLYIENTSENLSILSGLQTDEGITIDDSGAYPLLGLLLEKGLLEVGHCQDMKRNELYYEYLNYDFKQVCDKKILIFGAGAAGGTITYLLAQQGFTNITCLDGDVVEISDVDKTTIYDAKDIGVAKVEALQKKIYANFGETINIIPSYLEDIKEIFTILKEVNPDLVVYAIDPRPSYKLALNEYCVGHNISIIHAGYSYERILYGPFVIPGKTSCMKGYNEYWKRRTKGEMDFSKLKRLSDSYSVHPSISFNINILSNIVVKDIIFGLGESFEWVQSLNKQIIIDITSFEVTEMELSCGFCSTCKIDIRN